MVRVSEFLYFALLCSLDPEVWEVRIHLDGVDNLERKLARDNITYINLLALIETQGYSIRDSIYCRKGSGMELVDNNAKIYEPLEFFNSSKILHLTVKRGRAGIKQVDHADTECDKGVAPSQASCTVGSSLIKYTDQVVYDFSAPPVYVVDDEGFIFESQGGPYVCTQESINVQKGKGKAIEVPSDEDKGSESDFDMGEADFAMMEEIRTKEDEDLAERIEEMRRRR